MKSIIALLVVTVSLPFAKAEVFQGTFEWRRSGVTDYSTAEFEFDSLTGAGTIIGLNPNQGGYITYGLWNFSLGIVDRNLFGGDVIVSSFEELVDFSTRSISVMPESGFPGPPEPYSVTGDLKWALYLGDANGTISNGYSLTDGAMFNAYYELGGVRNFTAIPEPSRIGLGAGVLIIGVVFMARKRKFLQ